MSLSYKTTSVFAAAALPGRRWFSTAVLCFSAALSCLTFKPVINWNDKGNNNQNVGGVPGENIR